MTIEKFTTKKRAKLLGYLVGRYFVVARRKVNPTKFTLACFNVIAHKFFEEDWMVAVFAGEQMRFVTPSAKCEYIAGFSLAMPPLALTITDATRIGVLVPECAVVGMNEQGQTGFGGLMLSRYKETI